MLGLLHIIYNTPVCYPTNSSLPFLSGDSALLMTHILEPNIGTKNIEKQITFVHGIGQNE